MKVLTIILCIAYARASSEHNGCNEPHEPAASKLNQIRYDNTQLPLSQIGFVQDKSKPELESSYLASSSLSPEVYLQLQGGSLKQIPEIQSQFITSSNIVSQLQNLNFPSTPVPELQNQYTASSTVIPELKQGFSPVPEFQNEYFASSTIAPNLHEQIISSTPAPSIQNVHELNIPALSNANFASSAPFYLESHFSDQNPATVKAITRGGSIDEAFGVYDVPQENQETEVYKNFYFYAAPDEPDAIQPRINFLQPNKKNINVIFIKAPVAPKLNPIVVDPPEVKQDKTIVYVLVKKPELNQQITVKAASVAQPRKPEVFFLKYKNDKEAQETINNIKGGEDSVNEQVAVGGGEQEESKLFTDSILSNPQTVPQYISGRLGEVNTFNNLQTVSTLSGDANLTPSLQVQVNGFLPNDKNQVINIGGKYITSTISTDVPFVSSQAVFQSTTDSPIAISSTTQRYLPPFVNINK